MPRRQFSRRPLYEVVTKTIEARIASGEYKPDTPLPSVRKLAAELAVSSITVRRAFADLQNAGVLRAVPGMGTFVNATRRFSRHLNRLFDAHYGAAEDALLIGKTAKSRSVSVEIRDPQDPVFSIFSPSASRHLCFTKIILIDDEPMALEYTFVSMPLEDEFVDDLRSRLLYQVLRDRKMALEANRFYFDAAPASPDLVRLIGVPAGYPTLRHFYNPVLREPGPAIYGVSISPFDRMAYRVDIQGATG